jgi:hypothetical protein
MNQPMRINFHDRTLPYLPLQLSYQGKTIETEGMIDTGSTVNVLPYDLGTELGLQWDSYNIELELAGNLRNIESRAVLLNVTIDEFPIIRLLIGWGDRSTEEASSMYFLEECDLLAVAECDLL